MQDIFAETRLIAKDNKKRSGFEFEPHGMIESAKQLAKDHGQKLELDDAGKEYMDKAVEIGKETYGKRQSLLLEIWFKVVRFFKGLSRKVGGYLGMNVAKANKWTVPDRGPQVDKETTGESEEADVAEAKDAAADLQARAEMMSAFAELKHDLGNPNLTPDELDGLGKRIRRFYEKNSSVFATDEGLKAEMEKLMGLYVAGYQRNGDQLDHKQRKLLMAAAPILFQKLDSEHKYLLTKLEHKIEERDKLKEADPRRGQVDNYISIYEEMRALERNFVFATEMSLQTPIYEIELENLYAEKVLNGILKDLFETEDYEWRAYNEYLGTSMKELTRGFVHGLRALGTDLSHFLTLAKDDPELIAKAFKEAFKFMISNGHLVAEAIYRGAVEWTTEWFSKTEKSDGSNLPYDIGYVTSYVVAAVMTKGAKALGDTTYLATASARLTPTALPHLGDISATFQKEENYMKLVAGLAKIMSPQESKKVVAKMITRLSQMEPKEQAELGNLLLERVNKATNWLSLTDKLVLRLMVDSIFDLAETERGAIVMTIVEALAKEKAAAQFERLPDKSKVYELLDLN